MIIGSFEVDSHTFNVHYDEPNFSVTHEHIAKKKDKVDALFWDVDDVEDLNLNINAFAVERKAIERIEDWVASNNISFFRVLASTKRKGDLYARTAARLVKDLNLNDPFDREWYFNRIDAVEYTFHRMS